MAGFIATLELEMFDDVSRDRTTLPKIAPGNRSLLYRFGPRDGDGEAVSLGGHIQTAKRDPMDDTKSVVRVEFWADIAAEYVIPQAHFDLWYGGIIGRGHVVETTPGRQSELRITIELTDAERQLLRAGVLEWGGPARCTDEMAIGMGFDSVENLFEQIDRLLEHLRFGDPMTKQDWSRVLLATEMCFASNRGSTTDWPHTSGFSDDETISMLHELRQRLPQPPDHR